VTRPHQPGHPADTRHADHRRVTSCGRHAMDNGSLVRPRRAVSIRVADRAPARGTTLHHLCSTVSP
jgi:hypothetical protein